MEGRAFNLFLKQFSTTNFAALVHDSVVVFNILYAVQFITTVQFVGYSFSFNFIHNSRAKQLIANCAVKWLLLTVVERAGIFVRLRGGVNPLKAFCYYYISICINLCSVIKF